MEDKTSTHEDYQRERVEAAAKGIARAMGCANETDTTFWRYRYSEAEIALTAADAVPLPDLGVIIKQVEKILSDNIGGECGFAPAYEETSELVLKALSPYLRPADHIADVSKMAPEEIELIPGESHYVPAQDDARVRELEEEVRVWKVNHENLRQKNALLRQRDDLPVDRIPAHDFLDKAQKRIAELEAALKGGKV